MSTTTAPTVAAASSKPSAIRTCSTAGEPGSIRITACAPSATSTAEAIDSIPVSEVKRDEAPSSLSNPIPHTRLRRAVPAIGSPMWPRPTKPTVAPGSRGAGGSGSGTLLLDHALCDAEGLQRGRHPAVDGGLQQRLADLLLGGAVVERAADVRAELVHRFSAVSMPRLSRLRVLRSSPSRVQTAPQQYSVTSSWIGRGELGRFGSDRSTWAAPSTSRRTLRPCS